MRTLLTLLLLFSVSLISAAQNDEMDATTIVTGLPVYLNVYRKDSKRAKFLSLFMRDKIYHTQVQVGQYEFGAERTDGDEFSIRVRPSRDVSEKRVLKEDVCRVDMTMEEVKEVIRSFRGGYNKFVNNCNDLSDYLLMSLCGVKLPDRYHITRTLGNRSRVMRWIAKRARKQWQPDIQPRFRQNFDSQDFLAQYESIRNARLAQTNE